MADLTDRERAHLDRILCQAARMAFAGFTHHTRPAETAHNPEELNPSPKIISYICKELRDFFLPDIVIEAAPVELIREELVRRWTIALANACTADKTTSPACYIAITAYGKKDGEVIYTAVARPLLGDKIVAGKGYPPFYANSFNQGYGDQLHPIMSSDASVRTVAVAGLGGFIDRSMALLSYIKPFAPRIRPIDCAADALFKVALNELDGFFSLRAVPSDVAGLAHAIKMLGGTFKIGPKNANGTVPFACGTNDYVEACMRAMGQIFGIRNQPTGTSQGATGEDMDTSA